MRWRKGRLRTAFATFVAAVLAGVAVVLGSPATGASAATNGVCDLYAAGGTPCVGAHSTTRALFSAYNGPLYQVQRASDKAYTNIGLLSAGGVANAAAQDTFCANTSCTITKIYDQSTNHNDLPISWGGYWKGPGPNGADVGADAKALPVTVGGHKAYGVKVSPGVGYRVDNAKNAPTGSHPEGIYMVTSSNYVNQWCCFDYGSGENSHTDTGNATMNAIEWGTACWFKNCVGTGPWVEADLENGMYHTNTGSNKDSNNQGVHFPFVSAWEKNNGTSNFTLKYGNANSGGLTTPYSGPLPNGYSPMKTDSSLLLGTGGDNSTSGQGEFFEGAITSGYPSDATENAVQANITAAGYSFGSGSTDLSGTYQITNKNSGLVLDTHNEGTSWGTLVNQNPGDGGSSQTWKLISAGSGLYKIQSQSSGLYLGITDMSTSDGGTALLWGDTGTADHLWQVVPDGTGYYKIINNNSHLLLGVQNMSTSSGAQILQWDDNGTADHLWRLTAR